MIRVRKQTQVKLPGEKTADHTTTKIGSDGFIYVDERNDSAPSFTRQDVHMTQHRDPSQGKPGHRCVFR